MAETYNKKKQKILEESKKIFAKHGFDKTTMDDIAEVVGMKKNSLYYYFENKESLFRELFFNQISKIDEGQKQILAKDIKARKKIEELISFLLDIHSVRSIAVRTFTIKTFFEIKSFLKNDIEGYKDKQKKVYEKIFKEGIKNGEFKKINAAELADYFLTTMNALMADEIYKAKVDYMHEIDFSKVNSIVLGILKLVLDGISIKH